ncbi:unnamed protein product [marine sediment metagenome]|uniref:PUA domain-containing protein n=1 Tax=marine sediment metagenome TaxID=412755 RepID=X1BQN6_9ZZZZ
MIVKSRNVLSNKENKQLSTDLLNVLGEQAQTFFNKKDKLEKINTNKGTFVVKDKKIWFFQWKDQFLPSIHCLKESKLLVHKVVVDVGAIKFILNGANIMLPGIVYFDELIEKEDFVVVREEKADTIIAVGVSLISHEDFNKTNKGTAVRVINHLKDEIWNFRL